MKKAQCLLGRRQRGQLTSLPERQKYIGWLTEAITHGARKQCACNEVDISLRMIHRWTSESEVRPDGRTTALRPAPANALSEVERQAILALCNSQGFAYLPLSQVVPRLANQGRYIGSESSFYRVLRAAVKQNRRGRCQPPRRHPAPTTHKASHANQVWSWDITYLPSPVRGQYYYLYLIEDIYSRKTVGWEVHTAESGDEAASLLQRSVLSEKCLHTPLVLHSDNGAPIKLVTLLSKMHDLSVTHSRGRPRVSNDNAFSEALFKTLKYCPQWPSNGFANLDDARVWVRDFICWYNTEHRHSRIGFVTPAERHQGLVKDILAKRHALYRQARAAQPERWSKETRKWQTVGSVKLNSERPEVAQKKAA